MSAGNRFFACSIQGIPPSNDMSLTLAYWTVDTHAPLSLMTSDRVVMARTLLYESSCTSFLNMPLSRSPLRLLWVCACARLCMRASCSSHQGQHLSYSHFLLRQTQTQTLKRALQLPDLQGPGKESSLVDERSINLSATSSLSLFLPPRPARSHHRARRPRCQTEGGISRPCGRSACFACHSCGST